MGRGKRIVDVNIAEPGQKGGKLRIVGFLAWMKTGVFHENNGTLSRFLFADRIVVPIGGDEIHRPAKHAGKGRDDGLQRHFRHDLAFRAIEMRQQHDGGRLVRRFTDGRDNTLDTGEVADFTRFDRHVEIDADDGAFPREVEIVHGADGGHQRFRRKAAGSSPAMTTIVTSFAGLTREFAAIPFISSSSLPLWRRLQA